jgi:4-amino-4-deoxychorismate lyase
MISSFNGNISNQNSIEISSDRGFQYGDGFFESIRYTSEIGLEYFDDHFYRLFDGLCILDFIIPENFKKTLLADSLTICKLNNLQSARVKIIVWRKSGGLFTPLNNNLNYFISASELIPFDNTPITLGIASKTKIPVHLLSNYKTISALPYVLAGIEKKQSNYDELILLNNDNYICECTSSNIFWETDKQIFTPNLESGCIAGVGRKNEIVKLKKEGVIVNEGLYTLGDISKADHIWLTNSFGIKKIKQLIL